MLANDVSEQMSLGISIDDLVRMHKGRLLLEYLAGKAGGWRRIYSAEPHRPSLPLTGFVDLYTFDRVQVLGHTELLFLRAMDSDGRYDALNIIYQFDLPCVIVTNDYEVFPELIRIADEREIPLLRTSLSTARFTHQYVACIDSDFAPQTTTHGTLVDVYGVGLLLSGRSGIGKSEIALDLVERGHRLVADDVVHIRRQRRVLMAEANRLLGFNIEVRGIGILDVEHLFGIRAIRARKRVEVEVLLSQWDGSEEYERIGLDEDSSTILGVQIPLVRLPIFPGKNVTVICETIAMNHLLKVRGFNAAEALSDRLSSALKKNNAPPDPYLGDMDST
jgi:HPr kinase/phosphorylase